MRLRLWLLVLGLTAGRSAWSLRRTRGEGLPASLQTPYWEVFPELSCDGHALTLDDALQALPDRLQLRLELGGRNVHLDLHRNRQLLPDFHTVSYYRPDGHRVTDRRPQQVNCYYHGTPAGGVGPWSDLSLCSGLRGTIILPAERRFSIEPAPGAPCHKHVVHPITKKLNMTCETLEIDTSLSNWSGRALLGLSDERLHPHQVESEVKYVELVMVADNSEFTMLHRDLRGLHVRMMEIANRMDAFYRTLNLRVVLVMVEVWSQMDLILVSEDPAETLNRFLSWKEKDLVHRVHHDNAQLLTGVTFKGSSVGMATMNSMCLADRSGGVTRDHSVSVLAVASTMAHELGHNLGLSHDVGDGTCGQPKMGKQWIMAESTGFMPGLEFSNCSMKDLLTSLHQGGGICLYNVPSPGSLYGKATCGNLLVEKGEQCDCGLLQEALSSFTSAELPGDDVPCGLGAPSVSVAMTCSSGVPQVRAPSPPSCSPSLCPQECSDPCCDASSCQLLPGAECASDDLCCEKCKVKPPGTLCRQPLGECDLPEYCNGASPHCPANVYLQNGDPCGNSSSHCYQGECRTLQTQCQDVWGPGSSPAPDSCFAKVNVRGDKYGNCGRAANGSYLPCAPRNVLCGSIQCLGGRDRPLLGVSAEIIPVKVSVNGSEVLCRGTYFNLGEDVWDSVLVKTGTVCGPGQVCVNRQCRDAAELKAQACRCGGHGVCNSNGNCHCDPGWAPPHCDSSGHGGSLDSGPVTLEHGSSSAAGTVFLVLMVICLLVLLLFCYLKRGCLQRKLSGVFSNSSKCQYRITQTSSQPRPQRPPPPHWTQSTELQVMSTRNQSAYEGCDLPDPPSRPLPPDPVQKHSQAAAQDRPPAPTRPLPVDPFPRRAQVSSFTKPPPPKKPLPLSPVPQCQDPLLGAAAFSDHVTALPARQAPPPPYTGRTPKV